jgi:hemerythrin
VPFINTLGETAVQIIARSSVIIGLLKETRKAEHKKFVETVTKFKKDFDSGNATISLEVMSFLRDWLTKHINGTDKKYTRCFNDHGMR